MLRLCGTDGLFIPAKRTPVHPDSAAGLRSSASGAEAERSDPDGPLRTRYKIYV